MLWEFFAKPIHWDTTRHKKILHPMSQEAKNLSKIQKKNKPQNLNNSKYPQISRTFQINNLFRTQQALRIFSVFRVFRHLFILQWIGEASNWSASPLVSTTRFINVADWFTARIVPMERTPFTMGRNHAGVLPSHTPGTEKLVPLCWGADRDCDVIRPHRNIPHPSGWVIFLKNSHSNEYDFFLLFSLWCVWLFFGAGARRQMRMRVPCRRALSSCGNKFLGSSPLCMGCVCDYVYRVFSTLRTPLTLRGILLCEKY